MAPGAWNWQLAASCAGITVTNAFQLHLARRSGPQLQPAASLYAQVLSAPEPGQTLDAGVCHMTQGFRCPWGVRLPLVGELEPIPPHSHCMREMCCT